MTLQIYNITEAMSSVSPIIFNYNPANSKTLSMAAFSPSAFLPPAVAKWGWPPPPPWISLAASFTRLPAFSPPATRLSLSMTVSIGLLGSRSKLLINLFDAGAEVCYKIIAMIMRLAPIGVFCLLLPVVVQNGPKVLLPLLSVIIAMAVGCTIHAVCVYSSVAAVVGHMSPVRFFRGMAEAMVIAFTTCSSAGTLPVNMKNTEEKLGVKRDIVSFVLPLGATINMDGTALYMGVCSLFIANVFGIHLSMDQMMMIVLTGTLASIGTAGVPGAGLIMLAMVLQSVGLPLEGLALVAGIDRVLDMFRTTLNITGDAAVAVAIDATEKSVPTQLEITE